MKTATELSAFSLAAMLVPAAAFANYNETNFSAQPFVFPSGNRFVAAQWINGIGCPTDIPPGASTVEYECLPPADSTFSDSANAGALLAKTGPTASNLSLFVDPNTGLLDPTATLEPIPPYAGLNLVGVQNTPISQDPLFPFEVGYDLRKPAHIDPAGSNCHRAPFWEVRTSTATHYYYCEDLTADDGLAATGWVRLRWHPVIQGEGSIQSIRIIMDEGQDPLFSTAEMFGLSVIDNIDVNGTIVGSGGPRRARYPDEDYGHGEDKDNDSYQFQCSQSHPNDSRMSYSDKSQKLSIKSVNVRSIAYAGSCVSFVGDVVRGGQSGYTYTFQACDLTGGLLPTSAGSFAISVVGPNGYSYNKGGVTTNGFTNIHPHL